MEFIVEVCKGCKKLFHTIGKDKMCPDCVAAQADDFRIVKSYVRANKGAGVEQVSRACDVSHKQILEWVRDERLYFADGAKVSLPCLKCGKHIPMGKYCSECFATYQNEINAMEEKAKSGGPQAFTFVKDKRTYHSQLN